MRRFSPLLLALAPLLACGVPPFPNDGDDTPPEIDAGGESCPAGYVWSDGNACTRGDGGRPRDAGAPESPDDDPEPDAGSAALDGGAAVVDAGPPDASTDEDAGTDPIEPDPVGAVYIDATAEGWNLNGWGWSSQAEERSTLAQGARAVFVSMNRSWCGFVFARIAQGTPNYFAAGSHAALEFDLHPGTSVTALENLAVRLNNGNADVRVRDWVDGPLHANRWTHVRIPFAALNPSGAAYHRLEWFNASAALYTFTLDNVVLREAPPIVVTPIAPSLHVQPAVSSGQAAERFSWVDGKGRPRTADFVTDAYRGGYIRQMTYEPTAGATRVAHGGIDPSTGYQGFGYLVSHYHTGSNGGSDSADSRDGDYSETLKNNGHSSLVWQGHHHAIRSYTVDLHPRFYRQSGRGTVHATVHWLMASGRDPITFSVTYDSSPNPAGAVIADSRAPYGAIAWDGAGGSAIVSGVSWGDQKRFVTQGSRLSVQSAWSYTEDNSVPFTSAWTDSTDAEMGLVDTRSFVNSVSGADQGVWFDDAGRVRGSQRMDLRCWNRTSVTAIGCADPNNDGAGATVPVTWAWPFQMMNYGLGNGTTGKKIAWGTNYGAIGASSVVSFGTRVYGGYPYTSYSTQVVLGVHSEQAVLGTVRAQEAALATAVSAQVGSVQSRGAAGVGRLDEEDFETPGWDPVYGTFALLADANGDSTFTLSSGAGTLDHPLVVVDGARGEPTQLTFDGAPLQAGVDYFASVQGARAWITLARSFAGTHQIAVRTR